LQKKMQNLKITNNRKWGAETMITCESASFGLEKKKSWPEALVGGHKGERRETLRMIVKTARFL